MRRIVRMEYDHVDEAMTLYAEGFEGGPENPVPIREVEAGIAAAVARCLRSCSFPGVELGDQRVLTCPVRKQRFVAAGLFLDGQLHIQLEMGQVP